VPGSTRIERAVFATVLALNRLYQLHRITKWQHHLIAGLNIAPELLDVVWQRSP
jgi:hypothetical protein